MNLTLDAGIYCTTFFMLTGFHGLHVTIGTIMLIVILARCKVGHFTPERHFAFEAVAWYWHFVDVVWLLAVETNMQQKRRYSYRLFYARCLTSKCFNQLLLGPCNL